MSNSHTATRVAGAWLAIASVLLAFTLIGHGPIHPHLDQQMRIIAEDSTRWIVVHWAAAASLSLFAAVGLIVLSAGSRLTENGWTLSAWAVLSIGALWTMTTAVAEATVVANSAAAGDVARFQAWWAFSEAKANGFMFLCLSVAVIAVNEARTADAVTPTWASLLGAAAGTAAFVAWPLAMWFGIAIGSLFWVGSSLLVSLWTFWFGLALARAEFTVRTVHSARSSA